jgi:uncharacterized OB-fold protein
MSTGNDLKMEDWAKGIPLNAGIWNFGIWQPSPEVAEFWEGVKRKELLLKWCPHCKRAFHPKRIICTACGAGDLEWKKSAGKGKVYSFSEVHRAPTDTFAGSTPYTVGMVRLDEGVVLFTRFIHEKGAVAIDRPASVDFRVLEQGQLLPVFVVGK